MSARTNAGLESLLAPLPQLRIADRITAALALYRQRQALTALPDHLLDDIGVTREAALREAGRPVWDAPAHWRRPNR